VSKENDEITEKGCPVEKSEIERLLVSVLSTLTPRGTTISVEQNLYTDLKLTSDDTTAMALDMLRKTRIKVPLAEWTSVRRVSDVIDLLANHST
jgi:acyl carrier protein